jgi:hypothetical protein
MPLAEDIAQAALKNALKNALSSEDFVGSSRFGFERCSPA